MKFNMMPAYHLAEEITEEKDEKLFKTLFEKSGSCCGLYKVVLSNSYKVGQYLLIRDVECYTNVNYNGKNVAILHESEIVATIDLEDKTPDDILDSCQNADVAI